MISDEIVPGDRSGGTNTSHTIVVPALTQLLGSVDRHADAVDYDRAVIEDNVLGKDKAGARGGRRRQPFQHRPLLRRQPRGAGARRGRAPVRHPDPAEVVGQMLDYAANAVRYWPIDQIRADFEATHGEGEPDAFIEEFSDVGDSKAFWSAVEQNLRDGKIRMLFVADGFPDELVRVIEFLNEQMHDAEVLGIEVRQYTDGHRQVLVPRVIGATTAAEQTKRKSSGGTRWTRESMIETASGLCTDEELELLKRLLDFAEADATKLSWGSGLTPRVSIWHEIDGISKYVWVLDGPRDEAAPAVVWVWKNDLVAQDAVGPFLRDLEQLPGFDGTLDSDNLAPQATLDKLGRTGVDRFIDAVRRFVGAADRS